MPHLPNCDFTVSPQAGFLVVAVCACFRLQVRRAFVREQDGAGRLPHPATQADAEDVTQIVLVKLAQKLGSFQYDPSQRFRGWLKTITYHALSDYVQARRRPGQGGGGDEVTQVLESLEARDDLVRQLGEEFDRELLEEAMRRVERLVAPHHWQAFRLTALENLSGAEAAQRLGMKVATLFTTKSKVQKLIQEEVRRLEGDES